MPWFLLSASATNTWTVRTALCARSEAVSIAERNRSTRTRDKLLKWQSKRLLCPSLDGDHLPFRQLIACSTEAVIPVTNEPLQELSAIMALDGPSGAGDLSPGVDAGSAIRSEEHTSELQSRLHL